MRKSEQWTPTEKKRFINHCSIVGGIVGAGLTVAIIRGADMSALSALGFIVGDIAGGVLLGGAIGKVTTLSH